jgi:predicted signal transduction protein with EAL and GGDEF domain
MSQLHSLANPLDDRHRLSSQLPELPLQKVKIDRLFEDRQRPAVDAARGVARPSADLGTSVVVEGSRPTSS